MCGIFMQFICALFLNCNSIKKYINQMSFLFMFVYSIKNLVQFWQENKNYCWMVMNLYL